MKVLVAYALRKEMVNINWPGVEVIPIVTGEGKACAALELMRALLKEPPTKSLMWVQQVLSISR